MEYLTLYPASFARNIISLLFVGMLSLSVSSCQTDDLIPTTREDAIVSTLSHRKHQLELTKLFARAMQDPMVLSFLHTEADKQFDLDYDVLINLVKDQPLPGSEQTLVERLGELAGSQEEVEQMLAAEPLFTLFRPDTKANENRQATPLVAIEAQDDVVGYSALGDITLLSSNVLPKEAVWVAKTNERAVLNGGSTARQLHGQGRTLGTIEGGRSILLPTAYDPKVLTNARTQPLVSENIRTQDVIQTYWAQKGCDYCNARDRIYWKISRQNPLGENFSNKHAEAIPWFQMVNTATFNNMGGWPEGKFELWFRMFTIKGSPAVQDSNEDQNSNEAPPTPFPSGEGLPEEATPIVVRHPSVPAGTPGTEALSDPPPMSEPNRQLYLDQRILTQTVRPEDLFEFDDAGNPTATKVYRTDNLTYSGWNDLYWGNRIKFYIEEHDPEEVVKETIVSNTTLGTNFEFKVDGIPIGPVVATPLGKIGFSFGFRFHNSQKKERTLNSVITTTKGSDFLGEIECVYSDPLIAEDVPEAEGHRYREYVYNTGSIEFPFVTTRIAE